MCAKQAITGKISVHRRGFGFVEVVGGEDLFIPRKGMGGAAQGDTVKARVTGAGKEGKGPEGEVVEVLQRARSELTCLVLSAKGTKGVAVSPLLEEERRVEFSASERLKPGTWITVKVKEWGSGVQPVTGTFKEKIGHIDDPSKDIPVACLAFEIPERFPKRVAAEAKGFGTTVRPADLEGRKDLRDLPTITIDPETAKDFDDALSLSKDKRGHFHLTVHIADVSHYVRRGSDLDEEAHLRSNSTYFPGKCVPMLPPELSDNLCSLKANVNRLAVSVEMTFSPAGKMTRYEIFRSVIRSRKRFSYEEAMKVLEKKVKSPFAPLLSEMVELCHLLKKKRRERGSVEFALPEVVVQVDGKGKPTGTKLVEYDITHQLVEEFMLKANETVATHLTKLGRGLTYRVHEAPSEGDLDGFFRLAAAFGFRLPPEPTPTDLQALFDKAQKSPHGPHLAIAFIRSMKLATYSSDNVGHYGLSLEHYCHFTSPIRRYADLLVHRTLFENPYTEEEIKEIAHTTSRQERISARAENEVLALKKLRLLDMHHQKSPLREWTAVVAEVKPFGISLEIVDLMLDAFIHISDLGEDYYLFDPHTLSLKGRRWGETFRTGETVTVRLESLNLITRECRWTLVD
ncbi:MAG: ribonuclease R family protein [Parachlamydiales bacterium]